MLNVGETRLDGDVRTSLARWAADMGADLLVLFGSAAAAPSTQAAGTVPGDVDLALSLRSLPGPSRRLSMVGELQDLLGARRVDVTFLHRDTDPVLRFEVFRGGVPLYEAEPERFIGETVRALALYEDALPSPSAAPKPETLSGGFMTREVLARKLKLLRRYLEDLSPHAGKSAEEIVEDPYEIERLLELLLQVAVDIVTHELAEQGVVPETDRGGFVHAGRHGLLPEDLAGSLADAAGLRKLLVHLYAEIDYEIVAMSVERALVDFERFLRIYEARL